MTSSASGGHEQPGQDGDPLLGKVLDGRYRCEAVLGTGGVGVVYRATHLQLARPVAVKVLHGELGLIDELRRRFEREGQVLSALSHPHIVAINDFGIADSTPYLVMELLEGRTLADLIDDDGPPDPELAIAMVREMLRGLAFAHARGIVHRDFKAANIFLVSLPDSPHHVKILDFGLAKIYATEDGDEPLRDRTLTKSGTILGTPAYMSPEQASGSAVDERTDVYSAGVVLFEVLTGRYPFQASTRADMLRAHMLEPVPSLGAARPGLWADPALEALVAKSMAKERSSRYPHAQAMLDALDALPRPCASFDAASAAKRNRPSSAPPEDPTMPVSSDGNRPSDRPTEGPEANTVRLLGWRRHALVGGSAAAVLVGAVLAAVTMSGGATRDTHDAPPEAESAPSEPAAAQPREEPRDPLLDEIEEMEAAEAAAGIEPAGDNPRAGMPPAIDPFETVLPQSVRRYHSKVRRGQALSRGERRELQRLQRTMPEDPRPTLVLAHHFVDINFLSDAIDRYRLAFEIDPSARGDARMLRDLVRLSGNRAVGDRASGLIDRVYGAEAVPEVERQISTTMEPEAIDRLMQLRNRLRGD
jgi:serine/threonine-protein kinase